MINGLSTALGWSANHPPCPLHSILIGDNIDCDGTPMALNLIHFYLSNRLPVCWVNFREPISVAMGLFRRLGCDLAMMEAQGLLSYIDGSAHLLSGDFCSLQEQVHAFAGDKTGCLVVFDEVSLFEPLACAFPRLTSLLASLPNASTLVYMRGGNEDSRLHRWLLHRSSLVIEVRPLASGLSRDFHGQVAFRPGGRSYAGPSLPLHSSMLFKCTATALYLSPKGSLM